MTWILWVLLLYRMFPTYSLFIPTSIEVTKLYENYPNRQNKTSLLWVNNLFVQYSANPNWLSLLAKIVIGRGNLQTLFLYYVPACSSLKKLCELSATESPGNDGDNRTDTSYVALAAQYALEVCISFVTLYTVFTPYSVISRTIRHFPLVCFSKCCSNPHSCIFVILQTDKLEAACVGLEHLVSSGSDVQQVLKALRCLIRLKLSAAGKDTANRYNTCISLSVLCNN